MSRADYDIEADVTLLGPDEGGRATGAKSGYRPHHRIRPDYLTSGTHEYLDREVLMPGDMAPTRLKLITPEVYPACIAVGDVLEIGEGADGSAGQRSRGIMNKTLERSGPE